MRIAQPVSLQFEFVLATDQFVYSVLCDERLGTRVVPEIDMVNHPERERVRLIVAACESSWRAMFTACTTHPVT